MPDAGRDWRAMCLRHPFIVIMLASLALTLPLIAYITPALNDSDLLFYKIIQNAFSEQLWNGELYPRWLYDVNDGLGSPVFFFYGPASFYLTSLLQWLAGIDSSGTLRFCLSISAAHLACGWLCYLWLKRHSPPSFALIVSVLYATLPYTIHILYVQTALAAQWALAGSFGALYGLDRLLARGRGGVAGVAFATAFIICAHILTFVTFVWVPYAYVFFMAEGKTRIRSFFRLLLAQLGGIGLSAIYWLPFALNQPYTQATENFLGTKYKFAENFMAINSLYCLPYFCFALVAAYLYLWKKEITLFSPTFLRFLFCVITVIAFLITPLSLPVWQWVPPLKFLQFPFRFLNVALPVFACFTGLLLYRLQWRKAIILFWTGALLLHALVISLYAPFTHEPILKSIVARKMITPAEYLTRWNKNDQLLNNIAQGVYDKKPLAEVARGEASLSSQRMPDHSIVVKAEVRQAASVVFRQFYFPGITLIDLITGHAVEPVPDEPEGFLSVKLPPGRYELQAGFTQFVGVHLGRLISLVSFIVILSSFLLARKGKV